MEQSYGYCLYEELGESALTVKMPSVRSRTKRPRGALLQLDIGPRYNMCRIGGRLRSPGASRGGANGEIPPLLYFCPYVGLQLVMRQNCVFSHRFAALFPKRYS